MFFGIDIVRTYGGCSAIDSKVALSPRLFPIPDMKKLNMGTVCCSHSQNTRSSNFCSSSGKQICQENVQPASPGARPGTRVEKNGRLTFVLEPLLQRFGDVEGEPFIIERVGHEAGSVVAERGSGAVVQLHALLFVYGCLLDEHPQLCSGEQVGIPHTVTDLCNVEEHRSGPLHVVYACE